MKQPPKDIKDFISYDQDTGEFRWAANCGARGRVGALIHNPTSLGYLVVVFRERRHPAHHLAWWWSYGERALSEIDHINGARADNRISNLRLATREQNTRNASVRRDSKTGVKGVSPDGKSFRARCWANGKRHFIGNFPTIELAARAVREFREKNHKEFHNHG